MKNTKLWDTGSEIIVNQIRQEIETVTNSGLTPAFIMLGKLSYMALCHGSVDIGDIGFINEFDGIPIIFNPDSTNLSVKVLAQASDCFLYQYPYGEKSDRT